MPSSGDILKYKFHLLLEISLHLWVFELSDRLEHLNALKLLVRDDVNQDSPWNMILKTLRLALVPKIDLKMILLTFLCWKSYSFINFFCKSWLFRSYQHFVKAWPSTSNWSEFKLLLYLKNSSFYIGSMFIWHSGSTIDFIKSKSFAWNDSMIKIRLKGL